MNEEMETLTEDMKEKEEEEEEDNNNNNNDKNKDIQDETIGGDGDGSLSLPSVEAVGVRHAMALLGVAGEVPLDVARTILAAHYRTLRATNSTGRQRLTGGFIQCPSCSTPWIAGLCKPRLLGCPRDPKAQRGRLRRILRRSKTHPGKLTSSEKSILARYRGRGNVIEVSCLVCRHKKQEVFPLPERAKKEEEEEDGGKRSVKKRKKRKGKEINAGLHLSSSSSSSSTVKKKKGSAIEESPIFTTSTRPEGDTHTNTHTPTDTPDNLPRPSHKNNSSHPRFKTRTKVLLGKDAPGATLHNPASAPTPGKARERKRAVENLKRVMSREKVKSEVCGERNRNSLGSFLDSLF